MPKKPLACRDGVPQGAGQLELQSALEAPQRGREGAYGPRHGITFNAASPAGFSTGCRPGAAAVLLGLLWSRPTGS
jgi:hypothetical protein